MMISDYDDVYSLWLSCPGMGLNTIDDSRDGIARFLERNPDTCFVAELDGMIVGVILSGHDGRRGHIYHTSVSVRFQKRGIGKLLVDAALSSLKQHGISKVTLVVFANNKAGNAFWEKMGFSQRKDLVYRNRELTELSYVRT